MDPRIRADRAITVWLPQVDPNLALLTRLPATLFAGPSLADVEPARTASAAEGDYLDLRASTEPSAALLLPSRTDEALALVLPLDELFNERIEAAQRLHRLLTHGRVPAAGLTPFRRRRLKLALRALDGSLDGADYRAIAEALFGERVPDGAAFRADSLRAQAIRLVRYGVHLMRGGYLDLLRPHRRGR